MTSDRPRRRPSRRRLLGWGLGAAGLAAGAGAVAYATRRMHGGDTAVAAEVKAVPIRSFTKTASDRVEFGELTFRSGLVLSSKADGFGGFSALWRDPAGGRELVSLSDNAEWLTAEVVYGADGALAGLGSARIAPVLGEDGVPLRRGPAYDTEALAIDNGIAYVGSERVHEIRRFDWGRYGVGARGRRIQLPPDTMELPANASFEALAIAPPGHPLEGSVVAIAEEARPGPSAPTRGWVVTGPDRFGFDLTRSDDFDITDAAFLPSGQLLILERRFTPVRGVACRMRRIGRDALRPGGLVDGRVIFEVDDTYEIDNMEGLSLHKDAGTGQLVATLISDDNFSPIQRTVMLEFTIVG